MSLATKGRGQRHQLQRPYAKPTLELGPLLSGVTADTEPVSVSLGGTPEVICWVARAAFGEGDFRWMIFRSWLLEDAPDWFRAAYVRHGAGIGRWLAPRDGARRLVRAVMMPAVRRKAFGTPARPAPLEET
jgi:hypothetical protein